MAEDSSKKLFEDILISTPIDKMIEIIKENKEVNLEYVASKLNENIQKVEGWASILEDQGLIKIDYALSKVILKWNAPTKGEAEKRSVEYRAGKEQFEASIGRIGAEMAKEGKELEEYNRLMMDALAKYQPALEELKKDFVTYKEIGSGKNRQYIDLSERIVTLNAKVDQISDHLTVIEMNMRQIREEMTKETLGENIEEIRNTKENVDKMIAKMSDILAKIGKIKESIKGSDIDDRKLANFMAEAPALEERIDRVEETFKKIFKNQDLLTDAGETVKFFQEHMAAIEKKADEIEANIDKSGTLDEIEGRIEKAKNDRALLKEELEEAKTAVTTVSASLTSSMPELTGETTPLKDIKKEIESIKSVLSQIDTIKESVERLRDVDKIIDDISQLNEQVESEKEKLAKEVGDLIKLADEEVETYKTFERIRDRVVSAVDNYSAEVTKLKDDYAVAKKDMEKLQKEVDRISSSISSAVEGGKEGKEMIDKADRVISSFDKIKEAAGSIKTLKEEIERLNKNLVLLEKEYRILELRNPEEVGAKVHLAESQLDDYRKKKKELADVIKKMWSEEEAAPRKKK
jgi:chromosome segregation ATPase